MQPERDYLIHVTFRQLEGELKSDGIRPVLVDLRSGLQLADAAEEHRTEYHVLRACLREIDNCPVFIALLGGHWGSVPPADVARQIVVESSVALDRPNLSITAMEILYANW
jgi:hypothetical protein